MEVGKVVIDSINNGLEAGEDLQTLAIRVTLLHDLPDEVGGGGHTGMFGVPGLRKALLRRMLEEVDKIDNPMNYRPFDYLSKRLSFGYSLDDNAAEMIARQMRVSPVPAGNERLKMVILFSLSKY